jgi:hypothetical protein
MPVNLNYHRFDDPKGNSAIFIRLHKRVIFRVHINLQLCHYDIRQFGVVSTPIPRLTQNNFARFNVARMYPQSRRDLERVNVLRFPELLFFLAMLQTVKVGAHRDDCPVACFLPLAALTLSP